MTLTTVPTRAAEWIAQFLNNHEDFANRHYPREAGHVADLNGLSGENFCMGRVITYSSLWLFLPR
jgi:hypothetical protein